MNCYQNSSLFMIIVLLQLLLVNLGISENKCRELYCDPANGSPAIRFPFQLVDSITNNNHSGYSGYHLSCSDSYETMLELPTVPVPVKLRVHYIDYEFRTLSASDPENCLPTLFLKLYNSSIDPYQFGSDESYKPKNITFFNCSSLGSPHLKNEYQVHTDAQNMLSCPIYAAASDDSVVKLDLVSCNKMFDVVSPTWASELQENYIDFTWSRDSEPKCDGEYCLHCGHKPKIPITIIIGATGSIVLVLVVIALFQVYRYFRMKREDHLRVEKFLEDFRALRPTRFSYVDIKRITNGFKDKLGEGAHGAVFKGQLSNEFPVAVKILNNTEGDGTEFINEVGTIGQIHHVNVVRLLGFCADGFHRALVYDFFPNGSLQNFTSPPENKDSFLGWDKLQQIALGIAKGVEYLHQGCNHRILHFDINPHNVLLDDNLIPKITDFGLAKLCSKNQSTVSMTAARGTLGYIAPEVFSRNFGNVSYKSDIYSFGMLLLEMVGGRKNTSIGQQTSQVLYPEWIHNLIEGKDIHIHIDDEGDIGIAKKLAIVGLWCIQWHPVNRPSMKTVVQMLEGGDDKLKVPVNPFDSTSSVNSRPIVSAMPLNLDLEVIHEMD